MKRIKQEWLEAQVDKINDLTGSPEATYTRTKKVLKANIGNYHLDWAYSGVKLCRIVNDKGGVACISKDGFGTKRELHTWMGGYILGLEERKGK